ncbi:MAG TPA: MobF family relaxase, partial [Acidimicrobiales bacterium]|nr:MobF family relaxase [Acidimicrobiales bacterium]
MLRIHLLRPGGQDYYVDQLVPGRPEGTGLVGERPGAWQGRAAAELHLSGIVGARELGELLSGRDPANGRQLRAGRRDATAGFDLTFCAPKSVSLLGMLAPREIAHEVVAGHEAAVDDATGFLDRAAIGVRRARGGEQLRLGATGAAAGAFLHRTSRALDPHLHTHLVVANVAHGVDGDWSSLDSRRLFRHSSAIRAVYHARLRAELTARLGVAWDVRPSGMGDVVGVDPVLRGLFSGRSADIAEHLHGRRLSSRAGGARSRRI